MMEYFLLIIGAMFVNNFVLSQFLGICPFLGVSKKTDTALGMGLAVTFVMGVASVITWCVQKALVALGVEYLQTIAFILVIAALVQLIEMVLKKYMPALYSALGVYLPLITTNCAVLGVASGISLLQAFLNGTFSGVGFLIAIMLLAGVREKMDLDAVPKPFRGFPITLISASILSMAFVAFGGLISTSGAVTLMFP